MEEMRQAEAFWVSARDAARTSILASIGHGDAAAADAMLDVLDRIADILAEVQSDIVEAESEAEAA